MKKSLILISIILLSVIVLNGCMARKVDLKPTDYETINNLEGVTMTVKAETASPNGLVLVLENNSDKECIHGEFFYWKKSEYQMVRASSSN